MAQAASAVAVVSPPVAFQERRRTADLIFRGAFIFNAALTAFWIFSALTDNTHFFKNYAVDRTALLRVFQGILWFYVITGFIWYGAKTLLLKYMVGFSQEERRQAFSSRMDAPFDVAGFVAR